MVPDEGVYESLEFISLGHALAEIASGEPVRASRALLAAGLGTPDGAWVEACAVTFCAHNDPTMLRAGLLVLGHVARRFGALNAAAAHRVLARLAADPMVEGDVNDLREDLRQLGIL